MAIIRGQSLIHCPDIRSQPPRGFPRTNAVRRAGRLHSPLSSSRRAAFTIAEVLVLMALIAVVLGIFYEGRRIVSHRRWMHTLAVASDGSRVYCAYYDGAVGGFDTATGKEVSYVGPADDYGGGTVLAPEIGVVARLQETGSHQASNMFLQVCDLQTGQELSRRSVDIPSRDYALSPDGKYAATLNESTGELRLIDIHGAPELDIVLVPASAASSSTATTPTVYSTSPPVFSPDGRLLYVITSAGDLTKWDIHSRQSQSKSIVSQGTDSVRIQSMTISPDGSRLAISRQDSSQRTQKSSIEVFNTQDFTSISCPSDGFELAFIDSGKSLAVRSGNIEILAAATLATTQTYSPLGESTMKASSDGRQLVVGGLERVQLLSGGQQQTVVDLAPKWRGIIALICSLPVLSLVWGVLRQRRKRRTCAECGKHWNPVTMTIEPQCPECRLYQLTTKELPKAIRRYKQFKLPGLFAIVCLWLIAASMFLVAPLVGPIVGLLMIVLMPYVGLVLIALAFMLGILAVRIWKFYRLRNVDHALSEARHASGHPGTSDRSESVAVWSDSEAMSAGEVVAQMRDCRKLLEELTGMPCRPERPLLLLFFDKTASARQFLPLGELGAERPGIYGRPFAEIGCISLEGARRAFVPLHDMVRGIAASHLFPRTRGRAAAWVALGLKYYVAMINRPGAVDSWRRKVRVWSREAALPTFKQLFGRSLGILQIPGPKLLLPDKYRNYCISILQPVAVIDYLCGPDSSVEQRQAFRNFWRALYSRRSIAAACREALGRSLDELEHDWAGWLTKTPSNLPPAAPPEFTLVADEEVIPIIRNQYVPVQRRIQAVRALGASSWVLGADVLVELLENSQPDVHREAATALRMLSGKSEGERPEPWRAWLATLNAT